jgi:hypothetical protein
MSSSDINNMRRGAALNENVFQRSVENIHGMLDAIEGSLSDNGDVDKNNIIRNRIKNIAGAVDELETYFDDTSDMLSDALDALEDTTE